MLKQIRNQCGTLQEEICQIARSRQHCAPASGATAEEVTRVKAILCQN